jgi:hypothetical protein
MVERTRLIVALYVHYQFVNFQRSKLQMRPAVAQFVEALRYKPEGCGFDSRWFSLEFFIGIILPAALWTWGDSACKGK